MRTLKELFDDIIKNKGKNLGSIINEEEAIFLENQVYENRKEVIDMCKDKKINFRAFLKRVRSYRKIIPQKETNHSDTMEYILKNCSATYREADLLLSDYTATEIIQGKRVNGKWQPKEIIGKTIG